MGKGRTARRGPGERAGRRGRRALKAHWLALGGIVVAAAGLLAFGTTRVKEWTVQTDELLYTKIARHIAETGSPLPVLHGEHVGFLGVVYSIVLAPFYGLLDPVAAYDAAHVVNAVLFASTAIPVFLLGRRFLPRECALVVAGLSIAIPWAVNTATAMSESAAYPAFVWAVLACHLALAEPSPRHDLLAIGGLALAFFTRPQFLVLAAVLPIAALAVDGPRQVFGRHRVLAGAVALAVIVVIPLAALGETHRLLGDYGVTATEGSLLPSGVWKSAALHIDIVAVGLGVIPFLLGAAWVYSNLRGGPAAARAFAVFTGIALPLLVLETASYDLRFGGPDVIRDRYLLYLSPLLFLASGAALVGRLPVWGIVGSTAFFVATVALADFPAVAGIYVDSAVTVLNGVIRDVSPGLRPGNFVAVCGIILGAVCVGLKWVPRPVAMLGVTLVVFAFTASLTGYAFERLLTSHTPAGVPVTGQNRVRDWIDHQADGRSVALIAYPISRSWGQSAVTWWDAEFWNHSVPTAYVGTDGRWTYDPFPSPSLRFGPDGVVAGSLDAPKLVLVAPNDSRFGLAAKQVASNAGLALLKASRPWRADWASRGLDPDGWTRPERPAAIRVFAGKDRPTERVNVSLAVDAPPEAKTETRFVAGGAPGSVAPGARAGADVSVCVPAGGHADIPLRSDPAARIDGPPIGPAPGPARVVGVVLSGVQVSRTGNAC